MGHATYTNISRIASRVLRTADRHGASIHGIVDELERRKLGVTCSDGVHRERYMLQIAAEEYIGFLHEQKLIAPVVLTAAQRRVLQQWDAGNVDRWDSGDDGNGGEYGALDSIRWRTERKVLPLLHGVTH